MSLNGQSTEPTMSTVSQSSVTDSPQEPQQPFFWDLPISKRAKKATRATPVKVASKKRASKNDRKLIQKAKVC